MEDPEIANLARQIYQNHRDALDLIIQYRLDPLSHLTDLITDTLKADADSLGIIPMTTVKGLVRFMPKEWDTEANRKGTAWGKESSAYVLCELTLWGKHPVLRMVTGKAPTDWNETLWKKAENFPRLQKRKEVAEQWMGFFSVKGTQNLKDFDEAELEELANKIWQGWMRDQIKGEKFGEAKAVVAKHLEALNVRAE